MFLPFVSSAQESEIDSSFVLSGKIIDASTFEGIPFSHVKINETYWGVICDSLGFFRVNVKPNQELKVSALGFGERIVSITNEITDGSAFQEITLERVSYMLEEVDVYSLGTWEQFKHNFVKTELAKEEKVTQGWNFGNMKLYMKEAMALNRSGLGIGISINRKFKDRKQREHVAMLKSKEGQISELTRKFNKNLVKDITHETGKKLDALMVYISERENFTYQTRDFYIQRRIKTLHRNFVLEYVDSKYDYAMGDTLETLKNHLRPGE